jgi:predicted sugar kinase
LAVASALNELHGRPPVSAAELALSVQRGRRSAVGSYGFHEGGLIVERGKRAGAALSDSWERIALPESWKLLLIRPLDEIGLAGQDEMRAFQRLPSVSQAHDRRLRDTLFNLLVPAARAGNFRDFSEGVFQYGKLAGECFAPCQHGAFRSATITRIVQWNRTAGARGVGQSSWGPTIFCWCETTQEAELVAHDFRAEFSNLRAEILVAAVDPGAKVTIN